MKFNYNTTYDQQIIEMRQQYPHGWMVKILKNKKNKYLKDYILENTKFLDKIAFKFTFTTKLWYVINRLQDVHRCPVCGKPVLRNVETLPNKETRTIQKFCCSLPCSTRNEAIMDSRKQSNLKKYGCEWVTQTEWYKKMAIEVCLKKYGVKYYNQSEEYKNSDTHKRQIERITSNKAKLHAREALKRMTKEQRQEAIEKSRISRRTKYFNEKYTNNPEVNMITSFEEYMKMNTKKDIFRWKCNKCGNEFDSTIDFNWALHKSFKSDNINHSYARCEHCHPYNKEYSFDEIELYNYIQKICNKYGYSVLNQTPENRQIISPYEIDIYIPEIKLGIEYNGVFWHSQEHLLMKGSHTNKYGIYQKSNLCDKIGVSLIHIYEDEWNNNKDGVKKYLKQMIDNDIQFGKNFPMNLSRDKFPIPFLKKRFKILEKTGPQRRISIRHGTFTILTSGSVVVDKIGE